MQVNALSTKGLVHNYEVTVPAADLQRQIETRLKGMLATVQMPGFRPGKVPLAVVEKRYGTSVLGEVVEETVNTAAMKAVSEKGLRPATEPKVEFVGMPSEVPANKDLVFKMEVEIIPAIEPMDFSKLSFEKMVVEASESDINEALERIAKGNRKQEPAPAGYAAKLGDVTTIDFDGSVGGVKRDGMKGEDFPLELGSNRFIPGFEEQLVGVKAGDKRDVKVTFPKDYHATELAGAEAVFAINVKAVSTMAAPTIDDELAKAAGFETLDALKKHLGEQISQNFGQVSRAIIKRKLMDALADGHNFEVPPTLATREFEQLWAQVSQAKLAGQLDDEDKGKSDEQLKKDYEAIANRRVRLGLLLSEVARKNKIEINREDVRKAIIQEAMRFPGQEKKVVDYYTKDASAREQLTAPMLEEKVVDLILSKAKTTDKKVTRDELQKAAE
ncbi:MAG: trigger factor [Alphaproteobacteria bacterium]|nr:trigger factor [Alphaproteobacteria bacterium]